MPRAIGYLIYNVEQRKALQKNENHNCLMGNVYRFDKLWDLPPVQVTSVIQQPEKFLFDNREIVREKVFRTVTILLQM